MLFKLAAYWLRPLHLTVIVVILEENCQHMEALSGGVERLCRVWLRVKEVLKDAEVSL